MDVNVIDRVNSRPKNLEALIEGVEGLTATAARKALKEAIESGKVHTRGKGIDTVYFVPGARTPLERDIYAITIEHAKDGTWAVTAKKNGTKTEHAITGAPTSQAACRRIKKAMGIENHTDDQKHFDNDWRRKLATVE